MVMANSPATLNGSSPALKPPTKLEKIVAQAVADQMPLADIANKLAKKTGKTPRYWRHRLRRLAATSSYVTSEVQLAAKGEGMMYLGPSVVAVGARAARGRPDAAKLLWSMTGFHSERVSHEHSGDIQINVSIPRPAKPSEATGIGPGKDDESYVDAEVVED